MDGRTDTPSHRVAYSHLKIPVSPGLSINCHPDIPSVDFATTHFPRLSDVSLTPAVPFYVAEVSGGHLRDALCRKMTALPLVLVDDVLSHGGSKLESLDMSEMRLGEDYELAMEDIWSRVTIRNNQVTKEKITIGPAPC